MLKIKITGTVTLYRTEKQLETLKKDAIGTLIALIKDKEPSIISNPYAGCIDIVFEGKEEE